MEFSRSTAGALGPIQDRFRPGNPYSNSSVAALDGDERLGVYRAGKHPSGGLILCPEWLSLSESGMRAVHETRAINCEFGSSHYRGTTRDQPFGKEYACSGSRIRRRC